MTTSVTASSSGTTTTTSGSGSKRSAGLRTKTCKVERSTKNRHTGCQTLPVDDWVLEGKIQSGTQAEKDTLPWLRTTQVLGLDLVIIGSSTHACLTCLEAWHSGFRPVLVILEDMIPEQVEFEVRQMCSEIIKMRTSPDAVMPTGPDLLFSESGKTNVCLDSKGRACDVFVCTSQSSMYDFTDNWYFFKGPVVVVDTFANLHNTAPAEDKEGQQIPEKADAVREAVAARIKLHNQRTLIERKTITQPMFWEKRFDPERTPYFQIPYTTMVFVYLLGLLQTLAVFTVYREWGTDLFWLWRALADFVTEVPFMYSTFLLWMWIFGLEVPLNHVFLAVPWVGTLIHYIAQCLPMYLSMSGQTYWSDASCTLVGLAVSHLIIPIYTRFIKKAKVTRFTVVWFFVVVYLTIGSWLLCIPALFLYKFCLNRNGYLASIALPIGWYIVETTQVHFAAFMYRQCVVKPRQTRPSCVLGKQKKVLSMCILVPHLASQTGMLCCLLVGAIQAESMEYFGQLLISLTVQVINNILCRTGYLWQLGSLLGKAICPPLHRWSAPTSIDFLHNSFKFSMGYCRFFVIVGAIFARGIVHQNFNVAMLSGDPRVFCWNGLVLITISVAFMFDLMEDLTISSLGHLDHWDWFSDVFLDRFDDSMQADIFHHNHVLIPPGVLMTPDFDTCLTSGDLDSTKLKETITKVRCSRSPSLSRNSVQGTKPVSGPVKKGHDPIRLAFAPNMKHLGEFTFMEMQFIMPATITIFMIVMSMGIGNSALFGYCEAIKENWYIHLKHGLIWDKYCINDPRNPRFGMI